MKMFEIPRLPRLIFGEGTVTRLGGIVRELGDQVVLVTGRRSLEESGNLEKIEKVLQGAVIESDRLIVEGEPSPEWVDKYASRFRTRDCVVVGIGGGSALDAAKALAVMMREEGSVREFLEGVGTGRVPSGRRAPLVLVPTTAGTGSEATKNAVLSEVGPGGFKKSIRHNNYIPDVVILDPLLTLTCPSLQTAASGMDAFTQLLESYVSLKANRFTDALALRGLMLVGRSLETVVRDDPEDVEARGNMQMAAYFSGVTLANAGLGVIHGIAGPLGGRFPVPHGMACAVLAPPAVEVTVAKLIETDTDTARFTLKRYTTTARIVWNESDPTLIGDRLRDWVQKFKIPSLGYFGVSMDEVEQVISHSQNKNNPVNLTTEEMKDVLQRAI